MLDTEGEVVHWELQIVSTLLIRNLDIEVLFELFREHYSNTFEKVWEGANTINAVFIGTEIAYRTASEQSTTVIVIYDIERNECEITAVTHGGGTGLLRIDWGSQSAAQNTFHKRLIELAKRHGWSVSRIHPPSASVKCPNCGASYKYNEDQIRLDGTVECQNCLKSFVLPERDKPKPTEERLV